MDVKQAQQDVRRIYRGGATGPLVSAIIWAAAAATYQWASPNAAMVVLFIGGMLIFPLSTLLLKSLGGEAALPKGHPSIALAMQSAFTVPLGLLVAVALGSLTPSLFFPAALIIVGAHYLTFISLYGMPFYGVIAGVLVAVGTAAIFAVPILQAPSGWIGAGLLLLSTIPLHTIYRKEFPTTSARSVTAPS